MIRTGFARLEFNPMFNLSKKKKLRNGLSGVVQTGNTLWVINDETTSLERLTHQGKNANGVHRYGDHAQFALNKYLRLPVPPPLDPKDIAEADLEGLAYSDPYLWMVGSHGLKRKEPDADKSTEENFNRLENVSRDGNRFLLARIPLINKNGMYTPERSNQGIVAAQLRGDDKGNDLIEAMRQDKHLQAFLPIPSKDNGFDIEGLAVVGKRLFIGLRGPVLRGWTVILEVEPQEDANNPSILKLNEIGPGHRPYRKHFLQLKGLGIRDLCVQGADLLILAGPTMGLDGPVMVFRWPGGAHPNGESLVFGTSLTTVFEVPYGQGENEGTDHAEGMTLFDPENGNDHAVLIVYDSAATSRKQDDNGVESVEADIFAL